MSLTINLQSAGFCKAYGVIDKFGSSENVGKLGAVTKSVSVTRNSGVKIEDQATETQKISKKNFMQSLMGKTSDKKRSTG